jgi:RNA polymerase sigma factor (sigma-70 family)
MSEVEALRDLIRSVRAGDPEAASALVHRYEPYLRRAVRVEMRDPRLRRVFDSNDFCQSVLASFFARLALGQFEVESPQRLLRLLATMARHKVASRARLAENTRRTDGNRNRGASEAEPAVDLASSPTRLVEGRELLEEVRQRLRGDERRLSDLRLEGHTWAEIASLVGGNPDGLRFRLSRGLDRITRELGLEDADVG